MKNCLLIFFIVLSYFTSSFAQARKPKTYALIIGISKYKELAITPLNFADRDAQAFENFCTSDQGLGISKENVKILVNEEASFFNIMSGLNWLKEVAKKDDQVYFYFAGHGDMESEQLKYGYLLPYDSRPINYLGMSLSLDILNKTANTLSVDRKAKVFLITDACHSGKLAGVDFNGSNLVALNLMQLTSKNEVRITSCSEDQLSYEDQTWGGGRGAFSYFLTKGMAGEADGIGGKKDGTITIGEIKSFLNGKVPDNVQTVKSAKQDPVVMGNESTVLNSFKTSALNQNFAPSALQSNEVSTNTGARSVLGKSILEQDIINNVAIKAKDKRIDFKALANKPTSVILEVLLDSLIKENKHNINTLTSIQSQQMVAKTLFDMVQQIIDLYLSGDEEELEKRRYYSKIDKPYEQYPYMLEIAIKLLPKDHLLIPSLEMQKEYITGLSYRIKLPFAQDYMALVDSAMIHQQKALTLDSTAAYVHNEIGILYFYKKNDDLAKYHYEKARDIAPLWALPYSNLANLYIGTKEEIKDDVKAKKYVDSALVRMVNLQNPHIIDGTIYMNADNMLFAEEQFQSALKINDRHFRPFDKLGELHLKLQDYKTSEIYYYEGAVRKIGLNRPFLDLSDTDSDGVIDYLDTEPIPPCNTTGWGRDVVSSFALGKTYFDKKDFKNAKQWFDKVVSMDVDNPLVYHYLGQIAYSWLDYAKAEYYFALTKQFYLDDSLFSNHIEEIKSKNTNNLDFCALRHYSESKFDIYNPTIYLARTYEKWGYITLAAEHYRECLNLDPKNKIAYQMLWNMYKKRMELESAEIVMNRFGQIYPNQLNEVLADYYHWALNIFNEDVQKTEYYAYKYGLLMYEIVKKSPDRYFASFVRSLPNSDKKVSIQVTDSNSDIDGVVDLITDSFLKLHEVVDVAWIEPNSIVSPEFIGIDMLEKVKSISIDKNVKADVFGKIGDLYLYSNQHKIALENYESSLKIKEDNHYLRSMSAKCADHLYLHQKAFGHLTTLEQSNNLKYKDAIILAKYYMKAGERDKSVNLSEKINNTHPFLKKEIENDFIKLHLRFEEYPKVIELIQQNLKNDTTDMNLEYMLARAYAGLNNPDKALKHLQNAENLGFNYGFVYKNDAIFERYRTNDKAWSNINEKMEGFINMKMEKWSKKIVQK